MNIDILVIAAHPDDAELCCAGTILHHIALGKTVGILDLTKGEMGTRGNAELRVKEANKAAEILQLSFRENMGFKDYFFQNDLEHQAAIVQKIRKYRPKLILTNAVSDRHPDHGKSANLVVDAVFLSGLIKFETELDGNKQEAFRPDHVYHFIQNNYLEPDFIVDVSDYWDTKMQSIIAYSSQFYNPDSDEPDSFISSREFLDFIEARGKTLGHRIGVKYAEGFTSNRTVGVNNIFDLI
jgi:bacillithiol biosynthesis deacetylase BshB1